MARYLEVRERMDRNEGGWEDMAALFTDDATYIDPAWGRIDGIDAIRAFMARVDGRPRGLAVPGRVGRHRRGPRRS